MTHIAILGVSGHLGGLIATHVLRRSQDAIVHGICRSPDKLPEALRSNERFKMFQTSHEDAAKLQEALKGCNVAVFALNGDDKLMTDGQKIVIDACIEAGVPRYMAGDWSLDYRPLGMDDLPSKTPMKHIVQYLEDKEKETDGKLKGVHVLNGAFMEIIGMAWYKPKEDTLHVWGDGNDKWDLTTYNDAANFSAAVALDENATGWFTIKGDHISANDFNRIYKTAFAKEPKVVNHGSMDDLYKTMHKIKKEQPNNYWAWMALFYIYYSTNGQCKLPEPLSNDRYPDIKMTSLKDYLTAAKQPDKVGMPFDEM